IATDDDGAAHHQLVKVEFGADGTQTPVDATNPLPIEIFDAGGASVIPDIDGVVGGTDPGFPILLKHAAASARLSTADGDYDIPRMSEFGAALVEPEQHLVLDAMNSTSGWSVLGNDTINLSASTAHHVLGTAALEFDKTDGLANTKFAGVSRSLSNVNLEGLSPHDILQTVIYISDISTVDYVFLRLGNDASNLNEWRISADDMADAAWNTLIFEIGDAEYAGSAGTGINWADIDYMAVGVAFDTETDALANIAIDEISFHTNLHTNASLNSEVTTSVNSANINVQKIGNKVVNTQNGAVGTGTQRITIASDSTGLSALSGPANPTIDSYTTAAVNVATGANSELVGTPGANKQIWVYGLVLSANVAGTFSLQDEDDTALSGVMTIALAGGFVLDPSGNFAMPWITVATNKALEIDCVTCTADGIITYAIVSV
ncbi:hypothetical protein LCGC14_2413650, partial [marine sediment metagenome]